MSPIQILDLLLIKSIQRTIDILLRPLLVIRPHPEQQSNGAKQNRTRSRKIQTITDMVVWSIEWQETPGGDQTSDIAEHDVRRDGR